MIVSTYSTSVPWSRDESRLSIHIMWSIPQSRDVQSRKLKTIKYSVRDKHLHKGEFPSPVCCAVCCATAKTNFLSTPQGWWLFSIIWLFPIYRCTTTLQNREYKLVLLDIIFSNVPVPLLVLDKSNRTARDCNTVTFCGGSNVSLTTNQIHILCPNYDCQ